MQALLRNLLCRDHTGIVDGDLEFLGAACCGGGEDDVGALDLVDRLLDLGELCVYRIRECVFGCGVVKTVVATASGYQKIIGVGNGVEGIARYITLRPRFAVGRVIQAAAAVGASGYPKTVGVDDGAEVTVR